MLEKLLAELKNGSTTSPAVLAQKLDTTVGMVEAMLDTLEQQGYLQTVTTDCNSEKPCNSCGLAEMCGTKNASSLRIFVMK